MSYTENKYKPEFCSEVVRMGTEGKTIAQMAFALGVDKSTLMRWKKDPKKPEFVEAFKLARTACQGYQEDIAVKLSKGTLKGNATIHIFLMKNMFRDDYREDSTQRLEINNELKTMTDDELDELIKTLSARKAMKNNNNPSGDAAHPNS